MVHQKTLPAKIKILMVDDDKKLCRLVADYLGPMGYAVEAVHNGAKGLEMIFSGGYRAVFLDVMMPGMDGFEMLKRLREKSDIPVLMLTAMGDETDRIVYYHPAQSDDPEQAHYAQAVPHEHVAQDGTNDPEKNASHDNNGLDIAPEWNGEKAQGNGPAPQYGPPLFCLPTGSAPVTVSESAKNVVIIIASMNPNHLIYLFLLIPGLRNSHTTRNGQCCSCGYNVP